MKPRQAQATPFYVCLKTALGKGSETTILKIPFLEVPLDVLCNCDSPVGDVALSLKPEKPTSAVSLLLTKSPDPDRGRGG
jgi:hypothetical protein